ncbi:hypothetical protein LIA77_10530 [Sarocladium implicatum]|nr:hypothetical protein LIA77_10530 [Sarocladium implicatum]
MARLPTVDQFPSFEEACAFLKEKKQQCIWFLPNQGRLCRIPTEDGQEAANLIPQVQQSGHTTGSRVEVLATLAKLCCCVRHHRNKIQGTGLMTEVGIAWNKEVGDMPPASTQREHSPPVHHPRPLGIFGRHQVYMKESMFERICSPLNLKTGTKGSIYFYTHKSTDFAGMIKIGYTCKSIASRLLEWEECGHGKPDLLGSIIDVRHPERVELLTHFQLLEAWHEIMWCKAHSRTHIEWFKVGAENAEAIASCWNNWMHKANPYDRRGNLLPIWERRCILLEKLGIPITAQTMFRLYQYDVGIVKNSLVVEDATLTQRQELRKDGVVPEQPEVAVKKETED